MIKRFFAFVAALSIFVLPMLADAKSIDTAHYRVGGSGLSSGDEAILGKHELIVVNKFHSNDIGGDTWAAIKAVRTAEGKDPTLIFVYYNVHNSNPSQLCTNSYNNNTHARWTDPDCSHSQGNISIDNPTFPLKTAGGAQIHSAGYDVNWADVGNADFRAYALESVKTDLIGKSYTTDGWFADTQFSIIFDDLNNNTVVSIDGIPANYTTNTLWMNAINGFVEYIAEGLVGEDLLYMANRGNSSRPAGKTSWQDLDSRDHTPRYVLEEGAFVVRYGSISDSQFFTGTLMANQLATISSITKSYVVMQCGSDLTSTTATGFDGTHNFQFWDAFYYGLGAYYLAKKPGDLFAWTVGVNCYNSVGFWFDEYDAGDGGNLDFGSALGSYTTIYVSNGSRSVPLYKREFEKGYVFLNPNTNASESYYALSNVAISNFGITDSFVKVINHDNVLTAFSSIAESTTISLGQKRAIFLHKPVQEEGEGSAWEDANLVSLWRLNDGAITTDAAGSATLTNNGSTANDTDNFKEGDASVLLDGSTKSLSITDANLPSGFPLKSTETNKIISGTMWIKPTGGLGETSKYLFAKYNPVAGGRTLAVLINASSYLSMNMGYSTGSSYEYKNVMGAKVVAGQWYHVGWSFNGNTKAYRLRLYDATADAAYTAEGVYTQDISLTSQPLVIGANSGLGETSYFTGNIDEVSVFKDELTFAEMEQIQLSTYGGSFPSDWPSYVAITLVGSKIAVTDSNFVWYGNQTNFPSFLFDASEDNHLQTDGDDLRFTSCVDDPEGCVLPHELVYISGVDETADNEVIEVHVKVPVTSGQDKVIYAWYGNSSASAPSAASKQSVWSDYLAVYHGGSLNDSTANGNTLSVFAGTPNENYATGCPVGLYCFDIDGGTEAFTASLDVPSGADATLSVDLWWKRDTTTGERWAISQWDWGSTEKAWGLYSRATYITNRFIVSRDGGAGTVFSTGDTDCGTTWHHIVGAYDDSYIYVYVDGADDVTTESEFSSGINDSGYTFLLGSAWRSDTEVLYGPMNGKLDEVRISSVTFSADRVLTSYRNFSDPATFATFATAPKPDTSAPTFSVVKAVDAGPTLSDTINVTVSDDSTISTTSYGFSSDNICDETDTYFYSFTSGVDFVISGFHNDYLCAAAVDSYNNVGYQLVGRLNTIQNTPPPTGLKFLLKSFMGMF